MIEAVNSAIANSSLVRSVAEQAAPARASAAVAQSTANQIVLAPYISPFVYVDNQFNKAVLQIRDSETGEVQRQFPSEETLRNRAATQDVIDDSVLQQQELSNPSPSPSSQGTLQSATLFAASQIGQTSSPQITVPSVTPSVPSAPAPSAPSVNVAQAQIASAALSTAAQGGQATTTISTSA